MKLLHVSDWHLGRMTYNASRADDHELALAEIIRHAQESRPDIILHTGDLFDVVRPAYIDMARGITALQELSVVAPVVVLCGNHDSPALFDLLAQLLGPASRVRFISRARLPRDGGILTYETSAGQIIRLAPVPFIHANRMLDGFEDPHTWTALYADRVHHVEEALAQGLLDGFDNRRDLAIFAAHLHVGGAVLSGSERRVHVGESYASHLEHVPPVTYAAFGHIHKPQDLPGTVVNGRYAGSPIQLDFGELNEDKRVVLVDAQPGYPPDIISLPLSGGRRLWRFDGTMDELLEAAPAVGRVLALVTVHTPTAAIDLHARVQDLLPHAVLLQVHEIAADRRPGPQLASNLPPGPEPTIDELFRGYLDERGTRGVAADRVMASFRRLLDAVEAEQLVTFPEESSLGTVTASRSDVQTSEVLDSPVMATHAFRPMVNTGTRLARCKSCGAEFETPVRRGRPPSQCSSCGGTQR